MIVKNLGGDKMDPYTMQLGASFLEVAGRHSYEMISNKMMIAKEKKKIEEQQVVYEEIINDLMQDKLELQSVAGEYKQLYESLTISDKDIEHLQSTLESIGRILSSNGLIPPNKDDDMQTFIELFNKDTLKTAQLLGFNYKEAIGMPLTEVCSKLIRTKLGGEGKSHTKGSRNNKK